MFVVIVVLYDGVVVVVELFEVGGVVLGGICVLKFVVVERVEFIVFE